MKIFRLVLIVLVILISFVNSLNLCSKTPRWSLSKQKFPADFKSSNIRVLAFLKASCDFCQTQLGRLVDLQNEFNRENKIKLSILVINSFDSDSFGKRNIFYEINKNNTITLVQDTSTHNIWDLYSVLTDDMLVFDKCNRMVAHLTLPDSIVTNGKLKTEILNAHNNSICSTSSCKKKSFKTIF